MKQTYVTYISHNHILTYDKWIRLRSEDSCLGPSFTLYTQTAVQSFINSPKKYFHNKSEVFMA